MSNNFVVSIAPGSASTSNGQITYTYVLTMDAAASVEEPISYELKGVGANPASSDELSRNQSLTGTVVFKPGETQQTLTVTLPTNPASGPDKTFEVQLTSSLAWVTPNPDKDSVIALVSTTPKNGELKFIDGQIFSATPSASNDYVELTEGQSISTLEGNDKVVANGVIKTIDTGIGNDEVVVTNGGGSIALGAGDDTVKISSFSSLLEVDGGKGIDTLDLSDLDSRGHLSISADGFFDLINPFALIKGKVGQIKGFEKLIGTDGIDIISTGKGITMIDGGGGNDIIISNSGNDQLDGGDGDDTLNGGRGADILTGGKGTDLFAFSSIKDLNKAEQKIDVITDFKSGEDVLLLSFDHDTKTKDTQSGKFIGEEPFTKVAGQIRYVSRITEEGPITFIQGDTNGDGSYDWMIKLLGVSSLTKGDFWYDL